MPDVDPTNAGRVLPDWRPTPVSVAVWLLSPTACLLIVAMAINGGPPAFDWRHGGIRWTFFLTGILNMYAFSAMFLRARSIEGWEMKAIPLAGALALANAVLATLIGSLFAMSAGE